MKKVCHILNELLPSGAETMLVNSAREWKDCELHVVATATNRGEYALEFEKAGYIVHHIHEDGFIKQHAAIRKFLRELKPDVVHVHREGQECYYELDAKLVGVRRIVRTVHNVFSFTGILRVRRIMTRSFGRMLGTRYVAISKSVYDNEKTRFHNKPYALINNWCDEDKFCFIDEVQKQSGKKQHNESHKMILVSVGKRNSMLTA